MTVPEIRDYVGADSLHFLSYDGMIEATGLPEKVFSASCFNGIYPTSIGHHAAEITRITHSNRPAAKTPVKTAATA